MIKDYFSNIAKGTVTTVAAFATASKHLFTRSSTIQYPREKAELPDRTRHRLHVVIEDCIGCQNCERACPVECIKIEPIKAPKSIDLGNSSAGNPIPFWLASFTIDMAKCCYCGLCTDPCPTGCIQMTPIYEFSSYEVTDLVYEFSRMTEEEIAEARRLFEEEKKRKAEEKARKAAEKAAAAAAAPEAAESAKEAVPEDKSEAGEAGAAKPVEPETDESASSGEEE
jgi:NADH-quinone oxidoreductase subunit I